MRPKITAEMSSLLRAPMVNHFGNLFLFKLAGLWFAVPAPFSCRCADVGWTGFSVGFHYVG